MRECEIGRPLKLGEIDFGSTPFYVRITAYDAQPGAWGIQQYPIK